MDTASSETWKINELFSKAARSAGKIVISKRMDFNVDKKIGNEIVTSADIEANKLIVETLRKTLPDYSFLSEEQGEEGSQINKRIIIDPLDGTSKYVWGMSGYAISIAEEYEGIIRTSVVYDPEHDELFHAIHGAGAFRNGTQIKTSELGDISQALVSCDWGNKDEKQEEGLKYFKKLMVPSMIARRIIPQFAPANDLVRIAEGRIHGLICNDTWIEDHAAGSLIVQEAGGYVTNFYDRNGFTHNSPGIIATANKKIWDALCGTLFS